MTDREKDLLVLRILYDKIGNLFSHVDRTEKFIDEIKYISKRLNEEKE